MAHFTLFLCYLAILIAFNSAFPWISFDETVVSNGNNTENSNGMDGIIQNTDQIDATIENDNGLIDYVQANPSYDSYNSYFQSRIATASAKITFTYKLGKRITGDRLVSSGTQNQQWALAQNVTQSLIYPRSGTGAVITYVEVVVEQSSTEGRGFVTTGGIGYRAISIIIEAQKTNQFRQSIQIYGY